MRMRATTGLAVLLLAWAAPILGAREDPVQWKLAPVAGLVPPGAAALLRLESVIEPGWHVYSLTTPPGPIPTTIKLADSSAVAGGEVHQPPPVRKFDAGFNSDTEIYEQAPVFYLVVRLKADATAGPLEFTAQVRYQACTDKKCLSPVRKSASTTVIVDPAAPAPTISIPAGYIKVNPAPAALGQPGNPAAPPVASSAASGGAAGQSLGAFLLVSFLAGLAAIFTPCVFPMIPITMSFFLARREGTRGEGLRQALLFCGGIIVLFTGMGMAVTALLGPFGVVQLGSNPWVNLFLSAVFLAFGLSLLGAFEITLPSGMLTRLQQASDRGGIGGTLLMGVTFALTSFACVGPFVGTLLAASVTGGKLQPVLGMAMFAAGLALPFFFLALFPGYLRRLPKSGGWLARVKMVLGFIVLAAMLKYLSNVDQVLQWNVLTRERFLAAWVVLLALPGMYLLGFLRLEGVGPNDRLGVGRTVAGAVFLIFALSLLPGMFGARLGELDAYVPAAAYSALGNSGGGAMAPESAWLKNDYEGALKRARESGKLVLVSFTGYACTNCHWMKANMFPRPEVAALVAGMIPVELYTDGSDEASRSNQEMQEKRFGTVAIPFYAVVDSSGNTVAKFAGATRNAEEFVAFLKTPLAASRAGL
jgi:thiol:disulfide interchange protein